MLERSREADIITTSAWHRAIINTCRTSTTLSCGCVADRVCTCIFSKYEHVVASEVEFQTFEEILLLHQLCKIIAKSYITESQVRTILNKVGGYIVEIVSDISLVEGNWFGVWQISHIASLIHMLSHTIEHHLTTTIGLKNLVVTARYEVTSITSPPERPSNRNENCTP